MTSRRVVAGALCAAFLIVPLAQARASAAECGHVVVVTTPAVTWADIAKYRPPNILAAARAGATGSMAVRTITSRTSYASGFATIGAGSRIDAGHTIRSPATLRSPLSAELESGIRAGGIVELDDLADEAGYGARPGALATALGPDRPVFAIGNADPGKPPPLPLGRGRWSLLAAMDEEGVVSRSATGPSLLRDRADGPFGTGTDAVLQDKAFLTALNVDCSTIVIDNGDLERADEEALVSDSADPGAFGEALSATDSLVGNVSTQLDFERDLLLILSPTSPWWDPHTHLGIAIARGPGFPAGTTLESASTRRAGYVTLPDIAPTILAHQDVERPSVMDGRPWYARRGPSDRIGSAIESDREAVFVDQMQSRVSTAFVIFEALVYLAAIVLLGGWRSKRSGPGWRRGFEIAALTIAAFPAVTYAAGMVSQHRLGAIGFASVLVGASAIVVGVVYLLFKRPLDRLLVLTGATVVLLALDLIAGGRLQISTVFGYSPIVAGRFQGIGNIAFAVLAGAVIVAASLVVHRWGPRTGLLVAGALFLVAIVVDGAPFLGSDVGGVIALVPGLAIAWFLLTGRSPNWKIVVVGIVAGIVVLGGFLALDLARPPESRTHLARLFLDVKSQGIHVLTDTIVRKARANLRVFRTTIWTYFMPAALALLGVLLLKPRGRWSELARDYPRIRAGLIGGLVVAVLGFAVNDSGIVIPAVIFSYLVPMALLVHLSLESQDTT
ncbi:MAG: hypothetical protein ABR579_07620 [Actinomycetota bacterium]